MSAVRSIRLIVFLLLTVIMLSSCVRRYGHGVLRWCSEYPPVPAGTVLPVYIRSNINNVFVVGIPREFRSPESRMDKFEIPTSHLEFLGRSRRRAQAWAEAFAPYALLYAETLQNRLPIRQHPDNRAQRVYTLREGEIIKVLGSAAGVIPVGTTGEPLPGEWLRVLTSDGTIGFCFSYRLRLFTHEGGQLTADRSERFELDDPALDRLLDRRWSPEHYGTMVSTRRFDLEELSRGWYFDPGAETGVARINVREFNRSFPYERIVPAGTNSWRFEGTALQMTLRTETTLAVQFPEESGFLRTLVFVALPASIDDLIVQETARRERLFRNIFDDGPVFASANYGTLTFQENGRFTWTGNSLLIPNIIPASALGSGTIEMRLFLSAAMAERYTGAFTMRFDGIGGQTTAVHFMYSLDARGLRIEHVPETSLDNVTVVRRASSPLVIFFFRTERQEERSFFDFRDTFDTFDLFAPYETEEPDNFPEFIPESEF